MPTANWKTRSCPHVTCRMRQGEGECRGGACEYCIMPHGLGSWGQETLPERRLKAEEERHCAASGSALTMQALQSQTGNERNIEEGADRRRRGGKQQSLAKVQIVKGQRDKWDVELKGQNVQLKDTACVFDKSPPPHPNTPHTFWLYMDRVWRRLICLCTWSPSRSLRPLFHFLLLWDDESLFSEVMFSHLRPRSQSHVCLFPQRDSKLI